MVSGPEHPAARFEPRLGNQKAHAPFFPGSFYLVAFFGGVAALAFVAVANLARVSAVTNTREKTYAILAAAAVASVLFLSFSPDRWWSPLRDVRLGLRVIAVIASAGLYFVQRGPAFGAHVRFGAYHSMLKPRPLVAIMVAALAQGLVTVLVGYGRGVL